MSDIQDYTVVGVDVVGYTNNTLEHQTNIQLRLDGFLHESCLEISVNPYWIDLGDGGFFMLNGAPTAALDLIQAATRRIYNDNKDRLDDKKIDVRFACHVGQVMVVDGKLGKKYIGDAINNCARLMAGMSKKYKNQVVCSGDFRRKIIAFGGAPIVNLTRLPDTTDKHGRSHEVWNMQKAPGFGILPETMDFHENPLEWAGS